MQSTHLVTAITIILIVLFLFTGMEKIWHHSVFVIKLGRQPLPTWSKNILGWAIPLSELATVVLLISTSTRIYGLWVSAMLMLAFASYTAYASTEPHGYVPCACGKVFSTLSWSQHFWINILFFALAVIGIKIYYRTKAKQKSE